MSFEAQTEQSWAFWHHACLFNWRVMSNKIYNIPKILQKMCIKKGSKSHQDYEAAKQWLYYKPIDQYDYELYLKQIREYIGV